MNRLLLAIVLLAASSTTMAEVYTYIDAQGDRVYTDKPHANATRVDVRPSNNMSAGPPLPTPARKLVKKQPPSHYDMLRILIPEPDATIQDASGDMIVTITSDPPLMPNHGYRLLMDGNVIAGPAVSPVFALKNVDRGTHQLAAEVIDNEETVIERTPNQPFHMQRISLIQKRRNNPCTTADYGVRPECPLADKPADDDD
ncbi:hypothetical protein PMM47T1_09176 [Pseudomonas sp. M47T1]|uniref:DUF4124 domain-containing protein n=1 Tax=unclassified Pseudomonas TaxID=196821 RepID=UPI0002608599|nr:DUF4124 domain-containing protein [Pseudomonas sp. M47T1]EIK96819.1 hypothetical protein PMM47T1_09176 [Pseudomonas sp. M47T1]